MGDLFLSGMDGLAVRPLSHDGCPLTSIWFAVRISSSRANCFLTASMRLHPQCRCIRSPFGALSIWSLVATTSSRQVLVSTELAESAANPWAPSATPIIVVRGLPQGGGATSEGSPTVAGAGQSKPHPADILLLLLLIVAATGFSVNQVAEA